MIPEEEMCIYCNDNIAVDVDEGICAPCQDEADAHLDNNTGGMP